MAAHFKNVGAAKAYLVADGDDLHRAFQEARMSEAKSNEIPVGSAFVKQAELWMGAQGDVLSGVETMITGWAQRQRQVIEASSRSMQRMCDARDVFEGFVQASVVGVGGGETLARCRDPVAQPVEIDRQDTAVVDD